MVDEVVAQLLGRHQRLVALGQRALDVGARGHIEEGEQSRPVGQRQRGGVEGEVVGPLDAGAEALAMLVQADHHAPEPVPRGGIAAQGAAALRDRVDMRMVAEPRRVDAPHRREHRVEEFHPSVGAEHRHALLQRVERFALDVGERGHLRGERIALRRVVVEIGDAALGVGAGDDAQGAAVRQVPDGLARLDRLIGLHQLGLPGAEIRLLGQLALGPEPVEDLSIGRMAVEEAGIERPHLAIGRIVEGEPLRLVEDRDRGRQAVDHAGIIVFVAVHLRFQRGRLGDVVGDAGRPIGGSDLGDFEGPPLAADDCAGAALPDAALPHRRRRFAAKARIEQFRGLLDDHALVNRFDRPRIGGVAPDHPPLGVASPREDRSLFERQTRGGGGRLGLGDLLAHAGRLEPVAGNVADPHHGAARYGAAEDFEMAPAQAQRRQTEGFPPIEEAQHRILRPARGLGREPGGEVEHALRHGHVGQKAEIAFDRRLDVRPIPGDDDLRVAADDQGRPIDPGGGGGEFRLQFAEAAGPLAPRGEMDERRRGEGDKKDGETDGDALARGQAGRRGGGRVETTQRFVGARARRDHERERRRGGGERLPAASRPHRLPREPPGAEPRQRMASSRAVGASSAVQRSCRPASSARKVRISPQQDYEMFAAKSLTIMGATILAKSRRFSIS